MSNIKIPIDPQNEQNFQDQASYLGQQSANPWQTLQGIPNHQNISQLNHQQMNSYPLSNPPWGISNTGIGHQVFTQSPLVPSVAGNRYIFRDLTGKSALEIDFDKREIISNGSWCENSVKLLQVLKACLPR